MKSETYHINKQIVTGLGKGLVISLLSTFILFGNITHAEEGATSSGSIRERVISIGEAVSDKSSQAWQSTKSTTKQASDYTLEKSSEIWDGTKRNTTKGADYAATKSSEAWTTTKQGTNKALDGTQKAASESWDATKELGESIGESVTQFSRDSYETIKRGAPSNKHPATDSDSADDSIIGPIVEDVNI